MTADSKALDDALTYLPATLEPHFPLGSQLGNIQTKVRHCIRRVIAHAEEEFFIRRGKQRLTFIVESGKNEVDIIAGSFRRNEICQVAPFVLVLQRPSMTDR